MLYETVRLRVNSWRGVIGDLVELPASIAANMVGTFRAEYSDGHGLASAEPPEGRDPSASDEVTHG